MEIIESKKKCEFYFKIRNLIPKNQKIVSSNLFFIFYQTIDDPHSYFVLLPGSRERTAFALVLYRRQMTNFYFCSVTLDSHTRLNWMILTAELTSFLSDGILLFKILKEILIPSKWIRPTNCSTMHGALVIQLEKIKFLWNLGGQKRSLANW